MSNEVKEDLTLATLLTMTKKQLIVYAGFKNAKDLINSGMYLKGEGLHAISYLPSRKELARDLAA